MADNSTSGAEVIMAMLARRIEEVPDMVEPVVLEERIAHIQGDLAEIKVDVKRLDAKIDGVAERLTGKFDSLRGELKDFRAEVFLKFGEMQISMIKWMIGTLIAGIGAAFTLAKYLP